MERMTIRMDHGVKMAPGFDFYIDPDDYDLVQDILARLADYEDTGVTAEDIRAAFTEEALLKLAARYLGCSPQRLVEIGRMDIAAGEESADLVPFEARRAIYEKALATWGAEAQIMMAIEEMSELTKELCKHHRGRENREDIADEIADVTIMMEQLRLIFELDEKVLEHMDMKVQRLQSRLGG